MTIKKSLQIKFPSTLLESNLQLCDSLKNLITTEVFPNKILLTKVSKDFIFVFNISQFEDKAEQQQLTPVYEKLILKCFPLNTEFSWVEPIDSIPDNVTIVDWHKLLDEFELECPCSSNLNIHKQ